MSRPIPPRKLRTALITLLFASSSALGIGLDPSGPLVRIETVDVKDAGNVPDTAVMDDGTTGYGRVDYEYSIGKFEVTINQYTAFLNSVATNNSQPHITALWNSNMAADLNIAGIGRSGSGVAADPFVYTAIGPFGATPSGASSVGDRPITYVSWFDAARFANWMHNGATNGADTETGAYPLNGATNGIIQKNSNASWWIPSENEWYKAAYYKRGGINAGYWLFATGFDSTPSRSLSARGFPHTVNRSVDGGVGSRSEFTVTGTANGKLTNQNYLTDVGAFFASPGPYGTYDQSGNVDEWNDAVISTATLSGLPGRGFRGGSWSPARNNAEDFSIDQVSSRRRNGVAFDAGLPTNELPRVGFRLATVVNTNPAANADLIGLVVSDAPAFTDPPAVTLTPAFDSATATYRASCGPLRAAIAVQATAANPSASIVARLNLNGQFVPLTSGAFGPPLAPNNSTDPFELRIGDNSLEIVVTSADGTRTRTYVVIVSRPRVPTGFTGTSHFPRDVFLSRGIDSDPISATPVSESPGTFTANVGFELGEVVVNVESEPRQSVDNVVEARVNGGAFVRATRVFFDAFSDRNLKTVNLPLNVGNNTIEVKCIDSDGRNSSTRTFLVSRAAPDANANLSALGPIRVSGGSSVVSFAVAPAFSPGLTNYTCQVENKFDRLVHSTTFATAIVERSGASTTWSIKGGAFTAPEGLPGHTPLDVGTNNFKVRVTATDGVSQLVYNIDVVRDPSTNALLRGLAFNSGTLAPPFNRTVTSYTNTVPNTTTSISVRPTLDDANATMTLQVGTGAPVALASGQNSAPINLSVGDNPMTLVVTAQSGAKNTNNIVVRRLASSDANLSALAVSSGTLSPAFASGTTSYAMSVSNNVSSFRVTPTAAHSGATIKVNGQTVASRAASQPVSLVVGNNTVTVEVTAQDGTLKPYTLIVNRAPSTNTFLSGLSWSWLAARGGPSSVVIGGKPRPIIVPDVFVAGTLNPVFNKSTFAYTGGVVPSPLGAFELSDSIRFTARAEHPAAKLQMAVGNGGFQNITSGATQTVPLVVGENIIKVRVTAEDGVTTSSYELRVTRPAPSTNNNLSGLLLESPHGTVGPLSPGFAATTLQYSASAGNRIAGIIITPTLADNRATCEVKVGTGSFQRVASGAMSPTLPIVVGSNRVEVKVTAQSGAAKSYIVTVTRAAGMANLTLSSGTLSPTFDWRTEDYAASVGNETRSLRVTPTAAGATILVDVNNAVAGAVLSGRTSFPLPLNVGENTITFSVTSLDGTSTKNYRVKVTRAPSAVADLRVLTVRGGTLDPVFNSATSNYTMAVGASTASVRVRPYVTEANASIQVRVNGGAFTTLPNRWLSAALPVNPGANTVEIVVTAQDGTTNKTYTINVTRGT